MSSKKEKQSVKTNNRKATRKRRGFLAPFLLTLSLVVLVGTALIFVLAGQKKEQIKPQVQAAKTDKYGLNYEEIPEHEKKTVSVAAPDKEKAEASDETIEPEEVIDNSRYGALLSDEDYLAKENIHVKEAANEDEITITFAGDILFDPGYSVMNNLKNNGYQLSTCITEDVLQIMRNSDIMMINNEFPYSMRGTPTPEKTFTFRANPDSVSFLQEMGVDIVSLANNHAYDFGETALLDTFDTLEGAGIPYVGAGRNKEEAQKTSYFIVNDTKIAILSATQIERLDTPDTKAATDTNAGVFRCWNNKELLEQIRIAKENSDFVIVYIHWGTENEAATDWAQDKQAPEMADAGANLIIGDHPHCLQKIDLAAGVPVVYSLGNFWFNSKTLDTGMVQVTIANDKLKSLQFIPCLQSGCKTSLLGDGEKQRVLTYLNTLSSHVTLDADGYVNY